MDLTQLANLGEFIGGVAVLVTLVYLAAQVRQSRSEIQRNTETARAAAYHQAIGQIAASWMEPDFAALSDKFKSDPESLTSDERTRLEVLWSATLFGHEVTFELFRKGLIDPILWENMLENNRALISQPLPLELLRNRPGPLSRLLLVELAIDRGHTPVAQ